MAGELTFAEMFGLAMVAGFCLTAIGAWWVLPHD